MYLYHLHWLHLVLVQRMRLIPDLMEVDRHEVDAADVAVPCCPVIKLHVLQVGSCSKLSCTRQSLRNIVNCMLTADRNIEVIQNVKCLHNGFKSGVP